MKKGKSKSSSNTWRLVSLQLCRFSIPMPEKLRFRREIVPIIQLMALLQSFLEKNESISEIICLSLTIAFSIESFLIALKDTHFLRNTELKAILFYLRNLNSLIRNDAYVTEKIYWNSFAAVSGSFSFCTEGGTRLYP